MVKTFDQQVARIHRHSELVFECQNQVAVLESEYEELWAEFQASRISGGSISDDHWGGVESSAAQPLPPDGDEFDLQDDSKRRKKTGGDGFMDLDGLVTTPEVVESASQDVEVAWLNFTNCAGSLQMTCTNC